MRPTDAWRPNGVVKGYLLPFVGNLPQNPAPKVGLAALAALFQGLYGAVTVLAWVALGFWLLDFVSGAVKAIRDPDDRLRWERAGDGFLKLMLYVIMWVAAGLAEVAILEVPPHVDPQGGLVSAALGVIIWMEVSSIRENVTHGLPEAGRFFVRLLQALGRVRRDP